MHQENLGQDVTPMNYIYCSIRYENSNIPTKRQAGILFEIVKSNNYNLPKNPYYRCMIKWNKLTVVYHY